MNARSMYERKMQTQFANEQSRMAYEDSVAQDRRLRGNAKSEDRVDHKRRQRLQAEMAAERQAEAQLRQRELANKHRTFVEQEEKLATEMERRRMVQLREDLELQKIRNESEEIRDLEQKLRSAYLAKERAKQIDEKKRIAENDKHVQALMDLQVDADRVRAQKAEEEKRRQKVQDNLASRAVLDRQIAEQQEAKQRAFEEFVREKKMVDDIVAKIQEEAHQEELLMMQKRKETREYVQSYLQEREAWKDAERERVRLEDEAIANYVEAVRQREAGWAEKKAALEAEKEKIFQKISDEVTRQRQEQEEMLDLQIELANQEAEDRYIEAEKERMERRIRSRLEMMAANEKQKAMKKEQMDKEAAEEEEFRQRMLAKFAEDERLEQMNAQKRRMKQLEHRRAVEKLLEDRRAMYEAEKAREMEEQVAEQQRQEARANLIERERQRILAEHAQRLGLDNLPRGLLAKPEDLAFFKPGAAAQGR